MDNPIYYQAFFNKTCAELIALIAYEISSLQANR